MDDKEQSSTRSQTDKNEIDADANNGAKDTFLSRLYKFYVLVAMMLVYLINQMDRFVLGVGSQDITRELQFGQNTCYPILSKHNTSNGSCHDQCSSLSNQTFCLEDEECEWTYSATGVQYQLLAGPGFTFFFTVCALPMGLIASTPWVRRKIVLGVFVMLWSTMTLLAGFTKEYWQLLLARIGLGIFESGCTAFAAGIITDYFHKDSRGAALAFYNLGLYSGYSLAFVFNFIVEYLNWRWAFWVAAVPGLVMGVVVLTTVKEPKRKGQPEKKQKSCSLLSTIIKSYLQLPLILLCVGGGIRRGGLLVWVYNVKAYFQTYYCDNEEVGEFLSWVPLIAGSSGAILGGVISDRLVRWKGKTSRLPVLIISQLCAAPILAGVLFIPPPWAFILLIPAYLIGEMWIGVCLATVLDQVPHAVAASAVVLWLFINNNIGGSITLLVPLVEAQLGLRYSLLVLFPGCYVMAAMLFTATLLTLGCRAVVRSRHNKYEKLESLEEEGDSKQALCCSCCRKRELLYHNNTSYGSLQ